MKTNKSAVRFSAVLVALFAVILFPVNSFATHSWNGYHWARTANPFTLKVVDSNTPNWQGDFTTANGDWSQSTVMNLLAEQGDESSRARKRCVMITGKIQSCNAAYGLTGWLGLASINLSGSHITEGSSKMNDSYFDTSTYNNPNERLHVMCQEIGHTFGLDHQSTDGSSQNSCMDYFSNTGANAGSTLSTHPNAHDYDELVTVYTHLDTTTTIGLTSLRSSVSEVTEDPNSWGRITSQSANGRSSTYERQNFDGTTTATHVLWTLEAAKDCPGCDHRYDH